jgi:hypothetical protein
VRGHATTGGELLLGHDAAWASGGLRATPLGVRPRSHFEGTFLRAHAEGGSGRSAEASPTAIHQDTHSVEGLFREVRRYGVLGTSRGLVYSIDKGGPTNSMPGELNAL